MKTTRLVTILALMLTSATLAGTLPKRGNVAPGLEPIDDAVEQFMLDNGITAGVLGLMRDGTILMHRSYGWADQAQTVPLSPDATMRVASISKVVTAAAIHQLAADGLLDLEAFAFDLGQPAGGILDIVPFDSSDGTTHDPRMEMITVRHLLEHRAGWDRGAFVDSNGNVVDEDAPGALDVPDMTYLEVTIANDMNVDSPPSRLETMRWILGRNMEIDRPQGLVRTPGTINQYYSNEGYFTLGLIIEAVSGQDYLSYVRQDVLAPYAQFGCDMHLARSFAVDQDVREPWYDNDGNMDTNVYDPSGPSVPTPYGSFNIEARVGQGNIVSSVLPLLRVARFYNCDIFDVNIGTVLVAPNEGNHGGSLQGTNSMIRQRVSGTDYVLIFNKRGSVPDGNNGTINFATAMMNIIDDLEDNGTAVFDTSYGSQQLDCNQNGIADGCEIVDGTLADADGDLVADSCGVIYNQTRGTSHTTINEAIAAAMFGDYITVPPGIYTESVVLNNGVHLRATPELGAIIDGMNVQRPVQTAGPGTVIEGFVIRNGYAEKGGGVYVDENATTIQDCLVEFNECFGAAINAAGGGIMIDQAEDVVIAGCAVQDNTCPNGSGGGIHAFAADRLSVQTTTIDRNTAAESGGMKVWSGIDPLHFANVYFRENEATTYSTGGLSVYQVEIDLDDCVFMNNIAASTGGGLFLDNNGVATIDGGAFHDNTAGANGGGLWVNGASADVVQITNVLFTGNVAAQNGGAINTGSIDVTHVTGCTFEGNQGHYGGAIRFNRGAILDSCSFDLNTATQVGGAIYFGGSFQSEVLDCAFTSNSSGQDAGAIWAGNLLVARSSFAGNSAVRWGGAIRSDTATADACTFESNTAELGGAIMQQSGISTLTNCLIAGNTATDWGGGYLAATNADAFLINCTIADNHADLEGGGLHGYGSSPTTHGDFWLDNTIVWGNTTDGDGPGIFDADVVALHTDTQDAVYPGAGNVSVDPLFVDAATGDYRLTDTSPIIDHGDNALVPIEISLDLDGNDRFVDADADGNDDVDLGAYEFQGGASNPADINGDGIVDVADLLDVLGNWGACPGCPADTNGDGIVDVTDLLTVLGGWGT